MYCKKCGNKLSKDTIFCNKCGTKLENENDIQALDVSSKEIDVIPYATTKLVIGIISMTLFLLICVQSCAVGIGNALSESGDTSGSAGFACAIFMMIGGVISTITRKSKNKGGAIAALIIYLFAALITVGTGESFGDLPLWGSIAYIFGMINLASILCYDQPFSNNPKILTIGLVIISIIALYIGISSGETSNNSDSNYEQNESNTNNNSQNSTYGLGEKFIFDDLEITLGKEVTYTNVSNMFSNYDGRVVIKIPIVVKNIKEESHGLNMYYFKKFGPQGTELENISTYFDDCIEYAGDLRPNASYTKYLYLLYEGNGTYAIEFDNWSKKITVEFDIAK